MSKPANLSQFPEVYQRELAISKNWFNSLPLQLRRDLWELWKAEHKKLAALSFETVCKSETCIRSIWKHSWEPMI